MTNFSIATHLVNDRFWTDLADFQISIFEVDKHGTESPQAITCNSPCFNTFNFGYSDQAYSLNIKARLNHIFESLEIWWLITKIQWIIILVNNI